MVIKCHASLTRGLVGTTSHNLDCVKGLFLVGLRFKHLHAPNFFVYYVSSFTANIAANKFFDPGHEVRNVQTSDLSTEQHFCS